MPRSFPLTEVQRATLEAVDAFRQRGAGPSIRELEELFGITFNAVRDRLRGLQKKRLLDWNHHQHRALWLTPAGKAAFRNGGRLFTFLPVGKCPQCSRVHVQNSGNCQSEVRP